MRALITGATSGLGAAFARQLAAAGWELVLVARDADRLAQQAAQLGVPTESLAADLGVAAQVQRVAERCASGEFPIDLLINNAGFGCVTPLTQPTEHHRYAIEVMCTAVAELSAAAAAAMVARGHGRIMNVSSLSAYLTTGNYSPIKAWVKGYTEALALQLAQTGVTATVLCPGWIRTEFHERAGLATRQPSWLWADPDQVAKAALADCQAGKVVSIPTLLWRLSAFGLVLLPRPLIRRISAKMMAGWPKAKPGQIPKTDR